MKFGKNLAFYKKLTTNEIDLKLWAVVTHSTQFFFDVQKSWGHYEVTSYEVIIT